MIIVLWPLHPNANPSAVTNRSASSRQNAELYSIPQYSTLEVDRTSESASLSSAFYINCNSTLSALYNAEHSSVRLSPL